MGAIGVESMVPSGAATLGGPLVLPPYGSYVSGVTMKLGVKLVRISDDDDAMCFDPIKHVKRTMPHPEQDDDGMCY